MPEQIYTCAFVVWWLFFYKRLVEGHVFDPFQKHFFAKKINNKTHKEGKRKKKKNWPFPPFRLAVLTKKNSEFCQCPPLYD